MSEIRDKVANDIALMLRKYAEQKIGMGQAVDDILSNEHLAIVDREAKPPDNPHPPLLIGGVDSLSYETAQEDMVSANWVHEIKD